MTQQHTAIGDLYYGIPAIRLKFGRYEAVALPGNGANLISFRDNETGYSFLREPDAESIEVFKQSPSVYGIPFLYPPNRYEDGKFLWNGVTYELPINEEATHNHLHGFLHTVRWEVEDYGSGEQGSYVVMNQHVREGHPMFRYLPFTFTMKLTYSLDEFGLHQRYVIHNEGDQPIPNLFAFHTAIRVPFVPDSSPEDYKIKVTIGERRELTDRLLATGQFQPLSPEEELMKTTGVSPYFASMDNHYTAAPQNGRNYMELTHSKTGATLVYDVGTAYKHWMIWNNKANHEFICPEPQMNMINAPNRPDLPAEDIGLIALAPGHIFETTSRLYCVTPNKTQS
ncbi:aldose 1-epimerase [Paenibacillus polymyxa]|uniref:aldose 1-epimerase n=1 Tax=Paenibacillus polymyxa TaxID=1406 RepID=UPI00296F3654|nr:aldose 1-epimerase [Paenibacillus polymyxa]WOZ36277.1 aldose 1-epimerase [Paenibacillus polymyxa]